MVGEHFGIAPAELQRGGCITFVPDDGGVVEIVGGDERLIYHSEEDAVEKIDRMLSDPELRAATVRDVVARAALFTEERLFEILSPTTASRSAVASKAGAAANNRASESVSKNAITGTGLSRLPPSDTVRIMGTLSRLFEVMASISTRARKL